MHVTTRVTKNVGAIWLNLFVHAAVGFFLAPFILHQLGDQLFSLWVLVFALTGYYGLLDLGIRSATVRYVAKFASVNDQDGLAKFVNTSLAFYCGIGLLSLLVTGIGYFYLPILFKLASADLLGARVLWLIAGILFPFQRVHGNS
jgi:O-antigen/teichoic acid export membrane protein